MSKKNTFSDLRERDLKQRAFGCFGFSAIAHVTFLTTLLLSGIFAKSFHQEHSRKAAKVAGLSLEVKKPGARKHIDLAAKHEVLLADVADPTAVAMAPTAPKPAIETVQPIAKPAEVVKPKAVAAAPKAHKAKPQKIAHEKTVPAAREEAFQPAAVQDPKTDPEMLSPIIAEDPQGPDHALVAAGPSSDDLAAAEAAAAVNAPEAAAAAQPAELPAAADEGSGAGASNDNGTSEHVVDASARQPLSGNPLPSYPQADRLNGNQGTTVLLGHVGSDGRMSDVKLEKSSGSKSLDQASIDAFKNWRFAPGEDALVRKAITYSLNGEAKMVPARLGSR